MSDIETKPTGLASILFAAKDKIAMELTNARDLTKLPSKLSMLGSIVLIIQLSKIVALLESAIGLLEGKISVPPTVTRWIDAKGVSYLQIITGDKIRLVGGDGNDYDPALPVVSADVKTPCDNNKDRLLVPKAIMRSGVEEVKIPVGATSFQICVFAGVVNALGASLPVGTNLSFCCDNGLTEVLLVGEDNDASYLVSYSYLPQAISIEQVAVPVDEAPPPTGVLIPMPIDPDPLQMNSATGV
jgi:hypothetical protein